MPRAEVPASTPVAGVKVTADGNDPARDRLGVGVPVAETVKVPGAPTVNVVVLALVIAGGVTRTKLNVAETAKSIGNAPTAPQFPS